MGEIQRGMGAEIRERRERLARTEARIQGLVSFIADGDRSDAVVKGLRDLEANARDERAAIAALENQGSTPISCPSPAEIATLVFDLDARLGQDVLRGREELRRLIKGGQIRLRPEGKHYVARAEVFPLMLLTPNTATPPLTGWSEGACYTNGCGGRI